MQRQPQSRHLDAMCSVRDEPNRDEAADEHPGDEHPGDAGDARQVDVPPEDVDDARQEVDGRQAADHAYSAR